VGTYELTYDYERFKHHYTVSRTVKVVDKEKPVIKLKGDASVKLQQGKKFEDPGYTATDDVDGTITSRVKVTGYLDYVTQGTYTLTYTVEDASGNVGKATREVIVEGPMYTDGESVIYLTFDDGPSTVVTPKILNILKKESVPATFFVINYDDDGKTMIQREIDEGHTVAIHTYSHDYQQVYSSVNAFMEDLTALHDKLKSDFNLDATITRFPGGSSNTISRHYSKGVMTKLVQRVTEEGYTFFDWNVDSTDASGNNVDKSRIVDAVTSGLQEGRGNVILMHDTNAKQTTAKALKEIIAYGKENGYQFKAITEDTVPVHQTVLN
jgi:peptidoglycan/xylan/chitin deacetylase (PgdA/CDA1 family)